MARARAAALGCGLGADPPGPCGAGLAEPAWSLLERVGTAPRARARAARDFSCCSRSTRWSGTRGSRRLARPWWAESTPRWTGAPRMAALVPRRTDTATATAGPTACRARAPRGTGSRSLRERPCRCCPAANGARILWVVGADVLWPAIATKRVQAPTRPRGLPSPPTLAILTRPVSAA